MKDVKHITLDEFEKLEPVPSTSGTEPALTDPFCGRTIQELNENINSISPEKSIEVMRKLFYAFLFHKSLFSMKVKEDPKLGKGSTKMVKEKTIEPQNPLNLKIVNTFSYAVPKPRRSFWSKVKLS